MAERRRGVVVQGAEELERAEALERADRVLRLAGILARQTRGEPLSEEELEEVNRAGRELAGAVRDGLRQGLADLLRPAPRRRRVRR